MKKFCANSNNANAVQSPAIAPTQTEVDFRESVLKERTRTYVVTGGRISASGCGRVVSKKDPQGVEFSGRFRYSCKDSTVTITCDGRVRVAGAQFKVEIEDAVATGSGTGASVSFDLCGRLASNGHQNYTAVGFSSVRAGYGSRVHCTNCREVEVGNDSVVTANNCDTVDVTHVSASVRAENCGKIVVVGDQSTVLVVGNGHIEASPEALKNVTRQ